MKTTLTATLLASGLFLAGCGDTNLERGVTGAAIGGGVAAATGNNVAAGAAIGAGAGILTK